MNNTFKENIEFLNIDKKEDSEFIKNLEFFNASPDEKYGTLNSVDNIDEAKEYFQIEKEIDHRTKLVEDLNIRIESDYHNKYYLGNGNYGFRQIKLKK